MSDIAPTDWATSTQAMDDIARSVRRHDYDRFLCALLAKKEVRADLVALLAFNHEVSRIRATVSEPLLGQMRLQWWREVMDRLNAGRPHNHAVVRALGVAIERRGLSRDLFDRIIDARTFDMEDRPPADIAAYDRYIDNTAGMLGRLWLEILGVRAENHALRSVVHDLHAVWAMIGLLRAVPYLARARRSFIPDDVARSVGLKQNLLFAQVLHQPATDPSIPLAVKILCDHAIRRLQAARATLDQQNRQERRLSGAAISALLPGRLASLYLMRLQRQNHDPFVRPVEIAPLRRQMALLTAKWRQRI